MKFAKLIKLTIYFLFILNFLFVNSFSENLNRIIINGNERITDETILTFLPVKINDYIDDEKTNEVIKELYGTNFFKNVTVNFKDNILKIDLIENPIIQNITYNGIKSDELYKSITNGLLLLERSSLVENFVESDRRNILKNLQNRGYFFSEIKTKIEYLV